MEKNKIFEDEKWNNMFSDVGIKPFSEQEIEYVRNEAKKNWQQYEMTVRQLNVMLSTNKQIKAIEQEQTPINNQLKIVTNEDI